MIYVAGTGTYAADVVEIAQDAGHDVRGLIELVDPTRIGMQAHGLPVVDMARPTAHARVVIGAGGDRRAIWEQLDFHGWQAATIVHPRAHVPRSAVLGPGTLVGPGAVLGAAVTSGVHAVFGRGCSVGHHTEVGAYATVNPGADVAGNVQLGESAFLGIGAIVRDHVRIGAAAVVGAGAVVVDDVDSGIQVRGLPARPVVAS